MKQTMTAIYEKGVFRPLETPGVSEGQTVRLTVEIPASGDELLELAASVYEGLSDEEIADVERMALDRERFFSDRTK